MPAEHRLLLLLLLLELTKEDNQHTSHTSSSNGSSSTSPQAIASCHLRQQVQAAHSCSAAQQCLWASSSCSCS
jgi:hypothetical protein